MKKLGIIVLVVLLSACTTTKETVVPDGFIKHVDPLQAKIALESLELTKPDLTIFFSSGQTEPSKKGIKQIDQFLTENSQRIIVVRGNAGSEKYRGVGESRAVNVINYLRTKNVSAIELDYDPDAKGKRAELWTPDDEQITIIENNAPHWIIKPL